MDGLFNGAEKFNQPMPNWPVGNVEDMSFMFRGAERFNQNLNNWDTREVTTMTSMFQGALKFSGEVSNWNVEKVQNMVGFACWCIRVVAARRLCVCISRLLACFVMCGSNTLICAVCFVFIRTPCLPRLRVSISRLIPGMCRLSRTCH